MSDAQKSAEALALKSQNPDWGYIKIAKEIDWDKNKVRRAIEKAGLNDSLIRSSKNLPTPAPEPSGLSHYDSARHALAIAKSLDEVMEIADKATAIKEYARRAKDRQLQIDATEIVIRSERRLGEMLTEIKATTGLSQGGRPSETPTDMEGVSAPTLDEIGIDYKLSSRAQKLAAVPEKTMESRIANWRQSASRDGERVSVNILKGGPINGARSIMGDRREPDDSLDYFPTPPWATRALMEHALPQAIGDHRVDYAATLSAWEPACGEGHMSRVLEEYFATVNATDVFGYGDHGTISNFLDPESPAFKGRDWIITNPPFGDKSIQFVLRALDLATVGVAMFFRSQWAVEGVDRYESIFRDHPPTLCAYFVERVPLCKGEWNPHGTTATAYCWLVWVKGEQPRPPFWIPPGCRKELTRPDDIARFAPQYLDATEAGEVVDAETGEIAEEAA
jgi:hypothetical protein